MIISDAVEINSMNNHTIVLKSDGTAWICGKNENGQLGDGTIMNSKIPIQFTSYDIINGISVGTSNTVVFKNDGTAMTSGQNYYGQLGDGNGGSAQSRSLVPVDVSNLCDIISIGAGESHCMAIKDDGTVWAWGWNNYGQLGDDSTINRLIPVQVPNFNLFY